MYEEREELFTRIKELKSQAKENQRVLDSRTFIKDEEESCFQPASSFAIRLAISVLFLAGFLYLKEENRTILGVGTEKVTEAISRNVDLQEALDSVKMEGKQ